MKFVFPEFLYALAFLSIPILIHLFNFRRYKVIKFSQVKFLKNVKQETQAVSRLKHLLILFSRCLAIIALVMAFAQPFLPAKEKIVSQGKKGISIYIDNSFSMQVKAEKGSLIDIAKEKSIEIINAYSASDKFHLITNDFQAKNQRWLNKEQIISEIQEIDVSPIHRSIKEVLNRISQIKNIDGLIRSKYLISDLQKTSFEINELKDSTKIFVLPIQNNIAENTNLDRLDFQLPYHLAKQQESIDFWVKSEKSSEERKVTGQLFINEKLKAPFSFNLVNQDSVEQIINYRTTDSKEILGKLIIKDFPVTFDDTLYFNYSIQSKIEVLHLFEDNPNKNLVALLSTDSLINYKINNLSQIDFADLQKNTLIILDEIKSLSSGLQQELIKFNELGGSMCIFPKSDMEVISFNTILQNLNTNTYGKKINDSLKVAEINRKSSLFEGVFAEIPKNLILPNVNSYWQINSSTNTLSEKVLSFQNQDAFLSKSETKTSLIYLSSVGLSSPNSNFSNHALFVPIIYNMALQSVKRKPVYYNLNEQIVTLKNIKRDESPVHIIGNGVDFIPKQQYIQNQLQINLSASIKSAGHYAISRNNKRIQSISFNYKRDESNLESYEVNEIKEKAKILGLNFVVIDKDINQLEKTINEFDKGTALWKYFIILALVFLGVEISLLRFLK